MRRRTEREEGGTRHEAADGRSSTMNMEKEALQEKEAERNGNRGGRRGSEGGAAGVAAAA